MQWMLHQRAKWVPVHSVNDRCAVTAGRTGTRCNIGRPQIRWEDGVKLASEVKCSRATSLKGGNAVSIGTRIRNAFVHLSESVQHVFNAQDTQSLCDELVF